MNGELSRERVRSPEAERGMRGLGSGDRPAADEGSREATFYVMDFDLTGSRFGPGWLSGRAVVDGTGHTPDELREMCAEHYEIPVEQVGQPEPSTEAEYEGAWG